MKIKHTGRVVPRLYEDEEVGEGTLPSKRLLDLIDGRIPSSEALEAFEEEKQQAERERG